MSKFRLVVFDLDGTLVDSRRDIAESANATLVTFGAPPLPEDTIGRMVGDGAPVLVARAFDAVGVEKPSNALDRFLEIYDSRLLNHTRPYVGVPQVLAELSGRSTLAVLTNKPFNATSRILDGLELARFFSPIHVVAGDGLFPRKPDPQGLQHLMASAGASPEETALVGDSVVDWRTARHAAVRVCLARYGFGWEGFSDQLDPNEWVVDRPFEILKYL